MLKPTFVKLFVQTGEVSPKFYRVDFFFPSHHAISSCVSVWFVQLVALDSISKVIHPSSRNVTNVHVWHLEPL